MQKNLTISFGAPVKSEKSITYGEASYVYNARKIAVSLRGLFFGLISVEHWKRSAKETGGGGQQVKSLTGQIVKSREHRAWSIEHRAKRDEKSGETRLEGRGQSTDDRGQQKLIAHGS